VATSAVSNKPPKPISFRSKHDPLLNGRGAHCEEYLIGWMKRNAGALDDREQKTLCSHLWRERCNVDPLDEGAMAQMEEVRQDTKTYARTHTHIDMAP